MVLQATIAGRAMTLLFCFLGFLAAVIIFVAIGLRRLGPEK